jgi:hypothetical protein
MSTLVPYSAASLVMRMAFFHQGSVALSMGVASSMATTAPLGLRGGELGRRG